MRRHIELGSSFDDLLQRVAGHEHGGAFIGPAEEPPGDAAPELVAFAELPSPTESVFAYAAIGRIG